MTVRVRRIPAADHDSRAHLVVTQALLPILPWRSVPVLRERRVELTVLEKFVLEMALALGTVEPADFAEVTSLPPNVLAGAAWRLISSGTLQPRGGSYGVDPEKAATALRQQAVRKLVHSKASFALLPRTGDLLAVVGRDGGWLRELEQKLAPDRQAPLPEPLRTATRAAFLAERIRTGTVASLEADIVDVPAPVGADPPLATSAQHGDQPSLPLCPVYLCRAEIRDSEAGAQVIRAVAVGKRQRGSSGDPAEMVEVEIDLTGAHGLAAEWLKLADSLEDPVTLLAAWRELVAGGSAAGQVLGGAQPTLDGACRRGAGRWDLIVNGKAAQVLCDQARPLREPVGLAIEAEAAIIHLTCTFFPSDDMARALFARDDVIKRLLTAQQAAQDFPAACRDEANFYPGADDILAPESVLERIWQLGHYHLIYILREYKDFSYD